MPKCNVVFFWNIPSQFLGRNKIEKAKVPFVILNDNLDSVGRFQLNVFVGLLLDFLSFVLIFIFNL
jgi:hypothetical protein